MAAGIILILASSFVENGSRAEVFLLSLGAAIVSSTLLAILYLILGVDVNTSLEEILDFQRETRDLGLDRIFLHIGDETIFEKFSDAKSIDLMFNTAKNVCERYGDRISQAIITQGCKIRILVSDIESPIWKMEAITNGLCPGTDIQQEIKDLLSHLTFKINELKEHKPLLKAGSLEVRKYSSVPTGSIVIVDGKFIRHTPYLAYVHSAEVPVYDVSKRQSPGLFEQYKNTFNRVWNRSDTILSVSFPIKKRA